MIPKINTPVVNVWTNLDGVVVGYAGYVDYRNRYTIIGVVTHYPNGCRLHHLSEFEEAE